MRTKFLFPFVAVSALFVLACNNAPDNTGAPAADQPASITPPVDTVNDRYERNVEKQIERDTAKVEAPAGAQ